MAFDSGTNVNVKIGGDATNLQKTLKTSETGMKTWANSVQKAAQGPKAMLASFVKSNPMVAIGTVVTGVVGAMVTGIMKLSSFLNDIKKQADALDLTTDAYQRFQFAANKSNVGMDKVSNYLTRFSTKLEEAQARSQWRCQAFQQAWIIYLRLVEQVTR